MRKQGLSLILLALLKTAPSFASPVVEWTMINVNNTAQQGDAHLLSFPGGKNFLLDVGPPGNSELIKFLKKRKIHVIDKIIISHMHNDHYGGLIPLLKSGIRVRSVHVNPPPAEICEMEKPWGCDHNDATNTIAQVKRRGVKIHPVKPGTVFYSRGRIRLETLYAYSLSDIPSPSRGLNDFSLIMMLSNGKSRALFTGDLDRPLGRYLTQNGKNLDAQILKVPHHGTEGMAENEFFDRVNPSLALVPSPKDLWQSERSKRIRDYFESKKTETYVNGIHGHVVVRIKENGYNVIRN